MVVARALSKKKFQMYVRTYVVAGDPVSCWQCGVTESILAITLLDDTALADSLGGK